MADNSGFGSDDFNRKGELSIHEGTINTNDVEGDAFKQGTHFGDTFLTTDITSGSEDNSVVTARGTGDGLVLRLDGRIQLTALRAALLSYVETRQGFLVGQEVIFEWLGARPEEGVVAELTQILSSRFGVLVKASRMAERASAARSDSSKNVSTYSAPSSATKSTPLQSMPAQKGLAGQVEGRLDALEAYKSEASFKPKLTPVDGERFDRVSRVSPAPNTSGSSSLFDGLPGESRPTGTVAASGVINESLLWDDPDARIIRQTLRSGQKIESEFSVVIYGDVNSGAEVVAGGDVIILGKLRGVVHAGAFEESGRGRFIFAVQMQPTQLRIGSVISRGAQDESSGVPEVARVEGTMIALEPFMKASSASKKKW